MKEGTKSAIRIWACCMAFLGILLLLDRVVFASPNDPNGWQTDPIILALQDTIPNATGKTPNNAFYEKIWQNGFNPQDNASILLYNMSGNLWAYVSTNLVLSGNNVTIPQGCPYVNYSVSLNESSTYFASTSYTTTLSNEFQWIGSYNDIISGYEADYSVPNFQGGVSTQVNEASSSPNVPLFLRYQKIGNKDITDYTQYRVEVKARFAMPTIFDISRVNRQISYEYSGYMWSDWTNIYTYEDNMHLSSYTYNSYKLDLPETISAWTTLFNANIDDLTFNFNYNDTQVNKAAIVYNLTEFNLPMAGVDPNKFDIYVRFCKVENGVVKYGRWTHFTNGSIEVVKPPAQTLPEIPTDLPTGVSVLDDDQADDQINNNQPDPYIIPSIDFNFNFPEQNTLNYPTIVDFNHDNILVKMMTTANQLPEFFSGFSGFLADAFVFIDPGIWKIMAFGFMCSIVIMIIKVL